MKLALVVLAILLQSCSMGTAPEISGAASPESKNHAERHEEKTYGTPSSQALPVRSDTCIATLVTAEQAEDGSELSAFMTFNDYPPSQNKYEPSEVDVASAGTKFTELMACIEGNPFNFNVLIDGVLEEGETHMISPLTAWKTSGGYLAFYLHKNYEDRDGEGESVEVSGVYIDLSGSPVKYIQGLSSWYEYEGSVRIRNFYYSNGEFVTTEEVFDPSEQDEFGNVLDYIESPRKSIKEVYSLLP